jgi:O-antigen/teichoic acid export membrane protein
MVTVLYGARYAEAPLLVALIGILQTTRFLINWPSTVSLGMGRSTTVLLGNLARLTTLPAALIGLWLLGGLIGVVVGFTFGEMISIVIALAIVNRETRDPLFRDFKRLMMFALVAATLVAWNAAMKTHTFGETVGLCLISLALAIWIYRSESRAVTEAQALARRLWPLPSLRVRLP